MNAEEYKLTLEKDAENVPWEHKRHRRYENRIWRNGNYAKEAENTFGVEFISSNVLTPLSELEQDFDCKLKSSDFIFGYLFALPKEKVETYVKKVNEILKDKKGILERNKEIDKNFKLNSSYREDFLRAYYESFGEGTQPNPTQIKNLESFFKDF